MQGQRVEDVLIERLRFGLSPRKEFCDARHVAALAEVLDDLPPIIVHLPTMRVIDGVHRVHAARSVDRVTIRAVLFEGDEAEAHIEAVRSNVTHGKPLTLAEREEGAVKILGLVPEWSDRRIAGASGLSPKTVARLRGEQSRATEDPAQSRARVGRDGRVRPVDPSEVRRRVAEVVRSEPDASTRSIASRTGASQATVRDVRQRLSRGASELVSRPGRRRKRKQAAAAEEEAARQAEPTAPPADAALDFAAWFEQRRIDAADWEGYVQELPISRVYEVADACRRYSASWRDFAIALEDRARAHRRSSSSPPPGTTG